MKRALAAFVCLIISLAITWLGVTVMLMAWPVTDVGPAWFALSLIGKFVAVALTCFGIYGAFMALLIGLKPLALWAKAQFAAAGD